MVAVNGNVGRFVYDEPALLALEASLSLDRLKPYLELAEGDKVYAIRLYEWNTKVSESLYSIIQGLEVALRNRVHKILSEGFASEAWYDVCPLEERQTRDIQDAVERILDDGKDPTPGSVVAELMFGFWVSLFGTDYAQTLFDQHLWKCFPHTKAKRKDVAKKLKIIRYLRNRVAHHESVIGKLGHVRDLTKDVGSILELVGWVCPITAKWIAAYSSFDAQYTSRPQKPPVADLFPKALAQ
jgi:hypothetical protein